MELSDDLLRAAAGERMLRRAEHLVPCVHGLHVTAGGARGSVQARRVYVVEIDWSGVDLDGRCTCPHSADGRFCKHLAALGLAVLDAAPRTPATPVDEQLKRLDAPALRDLVRELATRDPAVARLVAVRTSTGQEESERVPAVLVEAAEEALNPRGFVDYRRSFDVARDAEELLDELERHLDAGAADGVRPALLYAVTELRTLGEHADDSAGVLGSAGQRAADLHARSCREGAPDRVPLARWLVEFRNSSPGWPETPLAAYVTAFDDEALTEYAAGVARLSESYADDDRWNRLRVDRMLLELADHRGDVDEAIDILIRDEHPGYGEVVDRLRGAGRDREVLGWMDRAVRAGRVSNRTGGQGRSHWLDPADVAATYLAAGRGRDALEVLRTQFQERPSFAAFDALVTLAEPLGQRAEERTWALATARAMAGSYLEGAPLIEVALGEGDLAAAWAAAQQFGPGHRWRELAAASTDTMPREAADLYRPSIEDDLRVADTRRYPGIADELSRMRDLYAKAGADAAFAEYMADIRARYGRRPSLMTAFTQRRLP